MNTLRKILKKQDILKTIKIYCKNNSSRQREDLYNYLNNELNLNLKVLDYKDERTDPARFACDKEAQVWETNYIVDKLL